MGATGTGSALIVALGLLRVVSFAGVPDCRSKFRRALASIRSAVPSAADGAFTFLTASLTRRASPPRESAASRPCSE